ncbi:MAG: inorganic diphosphatase, partial [Pseudomonadota bacterium]
CVVSERPITRANIIMDVRVIGGLRMIDQDEVDDKIVAIFEKDNIYGTARDIDDLPHVLIERLVHYFNTYKWVPGKDSGVVIETPYGAEKACEIVQAARADYRAEFGG